MKDYFTCYNPKHGKKGFIWRGRVLNPVACPDCGSKYWDDKEHWEIKKRINEAKLKGLI